MASQTSSAVSPPTLPAISSNAQVSPPPAAHPTPPENNEPTDSSSSTTNPNETSLLVPPGAAKTRDKLETISERIETQQSTISQITSVHQSPPLQRPPKSSKWKWLKTGSTGPETDSPPRGALPTIKASPPPPSTNPFDLNPTEDDGQGEKPPIQMSLFIPRTATTKSSENTDSTEDHVRFFSRERMNESFTVF